jgi:hypothetical protein
MTRYTWQDMGYKSASWRQTFCCCGSGWPPDWTVSDPPNRIPECELRTDVSQQPYLELNFENTFSDHAPRVYGRVLSTSASYSGGPRFMSRPETGYTDWAFSWFSSAPPGKFQDITLRQATTASFHIILAAYFHILLSNSLFTDYYIMKRFYFEILQTSINKTRINRSAFPV